LSQEKSNSDWNTNKGTRKAGSDGVCQNARKCGCTRVDDARDVGIPSPRPKISHIRAHALGVFAEIFDACSTWGFLQIQHVSMQTRKKRQIYCRDRAQTNRKRKRQKEKTAIRDVEIFAIDVAS
jgi:hypothetical protein